jgi:hypothetical protein
VFDGRWNRCLGWGLLLIAFAVATWLDPWSLGERDAAALPGSVRMMVRHAQAVVVAMAFLQLVVADLLAEFSLSLAVRIAVTLLSGIGTLAYSAGYGLIAVRPAYAWLTVGGAVLNGLAFGLLAVTIGRRGPVVVQVVLPVFCGGMLLDAAMGLFAADPGQFLPGSLGAEDGVRQRMLRLARAAAIALSLLALLYRGLLYRTGNGGPVAGWGQALLLLGAVTMPLTLVISAFVSLDLKYLLPIPAQGALLGTYTGVWLASPPTRRLERAGWLLVAAGMTAGVFMGLYAFDGPLAAPAFLGEYNAFGRRLSRLGHAYCIVLGLVWILLARDLDRSAEERWLTRIAIAVLTLGTALTLLGTVVEGIGQGPTSPLSIGPGLVAAGLLLSRPPWRCVHT